MRWHYGRKRALQRKMGAIHGSAPRTGKEQKCSNQECRDDLLCKSRAAERIQYPYIALSDNCHIVTSSYLYFTKHLMTTSWVLNKRRQIFMLNLLSCNKCTHYILHVCSFSTDRCFNLCWIPGAEAWPPGVCLKYVGGDQFGHVNMVMVRSLEPQEVADVSVQMCSPSTAGMYQGQWRMCTATGLYYGGMCQHLLLASPYLQCFCEAFSAAGTIWFRSK